MTETDAIVGIYGAVDRAIQADPLARLQVAQLLPQYRDPELHWYDDFQEWLAETAGEEGPAPPFADATDAVTVLEYALSQLVETQPQGRERARRMFAIAIAARAFPQLSKPDSGLRESAVAALRMSSGKPDKTQERAEGLYRLLAGEDEPEPIRSHRAEPPGTSSWWSDLVKTARSRRMLADTIGMFPKPCTGRLLKVAGVDGPVAALRTEHETDEIDFELATRFIEPVNWQTCMPNFWCDVHVVGQEAVPGRRRYHEEVSTHCGHKGGPGFWAETDLLFNFMWLPDRAEAVAAVANYELAEGRPAKNDRILVDEGTLLVSKLGGGKRLLITTTKRVKFSYPFSSEALALITCALGYADVAGDLLACAATRGKDVGNGEDVGTEFPGVAATAAPATATSGGPAISPRGSGQTTGAGGILQDTVDIWARAMREGARALERSVGDAGQLSKKKKPDRPEG